MRLVLFALGVPALLLAGCDSPSAPSSETAVSPPELAAVAFTDNASLPINVVQFVPCANGGTGEFVSLSGGLHVLLHMTFNGAGHATVTSHFNPQGISGIGQVTARKYQGTGVTRSATTARIGLQTTMINNFRIIGQGPGNNFLVHLAFHFTINANGTVTAFVDHVKAVCR